MSYIYSVKMNRFNKIDLLLKRDFTIWHQMINIKTFFKNIIAKNIQFVFFFQLLKFKIVVHNEEEII